jgi:8-oxo-dGTP pyrophosphatase MutT (NUDIX family)
MTDHSGESSDRSERWPGKRIGAAAVVVDQGGRVLLVKHTYGPLNWELPGGNAELDETFEQTALRELTEETGLRGRVERLTGIYYRPQNDSHHLVYRCATEGIPAPSSPEISACEYWLAAELPRPISNFTARRVEDALREPAGDQIRVVVLAPLAWLE